MTGNLVRVLTPEELELQQRLAELTALEDALARRELALATFEAELHAFEHLYLQRVGIRHCELDQITAQISAYMAELEADHQFCPTQRLRQLYREVAKSIHPDLATDEAERIRRQELMAEANRAYEAGDEARLQAILEDWNRSPESVRGNDAAADLLRTLRKIMQSQERLEAIEKRIRTLEQSDLYRLQLKTLNAQRQGQDLLTEMAHQLDQQIAVAQQRLQRLKTQMEDCL
ncbi:molecular chaperone DnaJ [Synechococcales cyanobacterium C]|uniref:Molecular chaperone DnaJ n=1 Tax=Petrachloros mirabilis ULC683 TaxID=2781853 RepID=A0A8K2ANF9_9CYAN|nr:molecular chaperone DnaJ [Petrachloros mirabilis]NCJ05766.1 molecular chaperone DnaJ [Petrachloros mirabilis ULC683]